MNGPAVPPPRETGDTGYGGDNFRQEPDITGVSGAATVPGSAEERGRKPGTVR